MTVKAAKFKTPKEITDYFDQKKLVPGFSWLDVFGEEHAHSFTVAKAVEVELLSEFHSTLSKAISDGQTFKTWKDELEPRLRKLGWWGPKIVEDPKAELPARSVNFASPKRLRTIFQSNMRSARALGQWQRIERTKNALPFILYIRTSSAEPRTQHLLFEGIILPVDHPFWRTHFPPNGWGCKCSVRQLTRREAQRLGYNQNESGPQIVYKKFVDRRNGRTIDVPEGIDPGWHANPGISRARTLTRIFADNLDAAPVNLAAQQVRSFWQSKDRNTILNMKSPGVNLPVAVSKVLSDELETQGSLITVFADEARSKLKRDKGRILAFDLLPDILMRGVVVDEHQDGKRTVLFEDNGKWFKAVVGGRTGYLRLVTFYQIRGSYAQSIIETYGIRNQE